MSARRIDIAAETVRAQVAALLAEYPDLADDELLRADVLEGETDLHRLLDALDEADAQDEADCDALRDRELQLSGRRRRIEGRGAARRVLMLRLLDAAGLRSVPLSAATLTVTAGRNRAHVADVNALPDEFCRIVRSPDLKAIGDALKAGAPVPGATLTNGAPTLTIRRG